MKKSLIQAYLEDGNCYWGVTVLDFKIQGNIIHVRINCDYECQVHELDIEMYAVMEFIWDTMLEDKS